MSKRYFYWNLHKGQWSKMVKGKVVGRHASVVLSGVEFRVRPGGRERVRQEGKKNVHAFAITEGFPFAEDVIPHLGERFEGRVGIDGMPWVELTYNPYKHEGFVVKATEEPVRWADVAVLTADRRVFARGIK